MFKGFPHPPVYSKEVTVCRQNSDFVLLLLTEFKLSAISEVIKPFVWCCVRLWGVCGLFFFTAFSVAFSDLPCALQHFILQVYILPIWFSFKKIKLCVLL